MRILLSLVFFLMAFPSLLLAEERDAGSTDISFYVFLEDGTDGSDETGVAFGSVSAYYYREGASSETQIPLSALSNVDDAHSDGGWIEIDSINMPGLYRIDLPDAFFSAGADSATLQLTVAGMRTYRERIKLVAAAGPVDVTTIEGTDATDQIDARIDARLAANDVVDNTDLNARTLPSANYFDPAADTVANVTTTATLTGHTPQTGDSFARLGAPAGVSVSADVAAVKSDSGAILVDTAEIGIDGAGLSKIPWNVDWDPEIQSEADDAIKANELDHFFLTDYDPASKPGSATAWANEMVESDGGVTRYTANALENGPSGGGGGTNITQIEGVDATDQIDARIDARLAANDVVDNTDLNARTLPSANYFDPAVDAVANVTTTGSVTAGVLIAAGQSVDSVTNPVTAGTVTDKTGYSIAGTKNTLDDLNDLDAAAVQVAVAAEIVAYHLDHLFFAAINPAAPPGDGGSLLNSIFEDDGGVSRYTVNVLENGPSGAALKDWLVAEIEQIRYRLGIDGAKTAPVGAGPELGNIGGGGPINSDTNQ